MEKNGPLLKRDKIMKKTNLGKPRLLPLSFLHTDCPLPFHFLIIAVELGFLMFLFFLFLFWRTHIFVCKQTPSSESARVECLSVTLSVCCSFGFFFSFNT